MTDPTPSDATATPQMGHGTKQRDLIRMSDDEVVEFLAGRHAATMSTLAADGSIHSVAMWYGFVGGVMAVETKAKAQKVLNLRRDPRITMLVEDGDYYEELRGVSLVGTAEVVDDHDRLWELGVSVFDRYMGGYTEEMRPFVEVMLHNRVAVLVHPTKVVTWDHRKLGLPSTRPAE
ncbi:MAG: PPOX class F420-dependent oxidoreductase [Actinomycetes bacterium]